MRRCACEIFVGLLDKPVVPDLLLKVAFWTLGEYAYLLGEFELEDGRTAILIHNQDPARTQWATVDTSGRKKLEKLLGALKPYALGVLGGLALAAFARRR